MKNSLNIKTRMITFENSPRYKGAGYQALKKQGFEPILSLGIDATDPKFEYCEPLVRNEITSDDASNHMRSAEIACYLNHLNLWKEFLETSDEVCLFVEDDAIAKITHDEFCKKMSNVPDEFDCIQLSKRENTHNTVIVNKDFVRAEPCGYGGYAYLLSRTGAKKLINQNNVKPTDLKFMQLSIDGFVYNEIVDSFRHNWNIPSTIFI